MSIRRRSAQAASLTGGDLSVDILHTEDSVTLGDETNKLVFTDQGGTKCIPVDVKATTGATSANQTNGSQKTQLVNGSDVAEFDDVGGEKALKVAVISTVGGGSGGTAATDSAAFTATATQFTPIGGHLDDTASDDLAEGEMGAVRMTAQRALHVSVRNSTLAATQSGTWNITDISGTISLPTGAATSAKQDTQTTALQLIDDMIFTDDAAFTPGTSKGAAIGAQCDETATDSVDEGDFGVLRMTADRQLYVKVGNNTDPATATLQATVNTNTGNCATSLALLDDVIFVDDAAFTAATSKVAVIGGQYQSTPNALDDGDAGSILLDANHAVQVVVRAGTAAFGKLSANSGVDIGDVDVTSLTCAAANAKFDCAQMNGVAVSMGSGIMGTGVQRVCIASDNDAVTVKQGTATNLKAEVVGSAAHDNGSPGVPVMIAGRARNASVTSVANGDVSYLHTDLQGRLITAPYCDRAEVVHKTTTIATTTAVQLFAAAASTFYDITMICLTNSNTTTAAQVQLKDAAAGTTRWEMMIPPNSGIVVPFHVPMCQTTANNDWEVDLQANVSTVYVYVQAVKRIA